MAKTQFPETVILKLPEGTLERAREAAEKEGSTPTDFMRRTIVRAVREERDTA